MIALGILLSAVAVQTQWNPFKLAELLHEPSKASAATEAELIQWFGANQIDSGADAKIDNLGAAWAIRVPEGTKEVVVRSVPDKTRLNLVQVGSGRLFATANKFPEGTAFRYVYEVDGKPVGNIREIEFYTFPPESRPNPGVPSGKLEQQPKLTSKIFGGTLHDWWIYTPANFDAAKESNLIVFQDGQWAHEYIPVFMDNLIAKGDLPQTIVVLVTPGTFPDGKSDRSREYDTLSDAYVRFLLEELLPLVEAKFKITQDPMKRCVAGLSSGGICSFTCAWQRPDKFGLVMSWIGSFTNIASGPTLIEGGHNYPALIRKTPKKPIRVFLQEGENDLDNVHGNWPLANHEMQNALEFSKYEVKAVWGKGFHSPRQGQASMPDALRWLFRP